MTSTPYIVNKDSKGILAQLLATENISVRHDPAAETAMFDIANRKLILPVWKDMTNDLYDMLVGHEVGHALFTPYDTEREEAATHEGSWSIDAQEIGGDSHGQIASAYINIVEDARIEKLMKQKFPGLRRDFVSAYGELAKKDFFGMKSRKVEHLMDKINLHFKLGVSAETECGIVFTPEEQKFVDRIAALETYKEMIQVVKDIWNYETENNKKKMPITVPPPSQGGDKGESEDRDTKSQSSDVHNGIKAGRGSIPNTSAPTMPETHDNFLSNTKNLVNNTIKYSGYLEAPEPVLKNIIITPKEIEHLLNSYMRSFCKDKATNLVVSNARTCAEDEARKFFIQSKKSVAVLVKQFEMKKAADAHKRTQTAKTGVLDCVKMMQYKFSEDIFARHVTVQEGKNHGVVMFIDWSSSMSGCIMDTLKQCFLIALFCKKCNIPFEVYAFSSVNVRREIILENNKADRMNTEYVSSDDDNIGNSWVSISGETYKPSPESLYDDKGYTEGVLSFNNFGLLNFVSSSMTMKEMSEAMANMIQIVGNPSGENHYNLYHLINPILRLNGTPLNECITAATKIVNEFRRANNIQVVNSIFLTDGEGGRCFYADHRREVHIITKNKTYNVKDFTTEREKKDCYGPDSTKVLLRIHAKETGANVIGFYLYNSSTVSDRAMGSFINIDDNLRHSVMNSKADEIRLKNLADMNSRIEACQAQYRKEGFFIADVGSVYGGYKELYIVRCSSLSISEEDGDLDKMISGSSIMKVRTAFRNQMKDNSVSKNLLNRFIDQIAA